MPKSPGRVWIGAGAALAERLALRLNELAEKEIARAHHRPGGQRAPGHAAGHLRRIGHADAVPGGFRGLCRLLGSAHQARGPPAATAAQAPRRTP